MTDVDEEQIHHCHLSEQCLQSNSAWSSFSSVSYLQGRRWQLATKYGHLTCFLHRRLTVDRAILTLPPSKNYWHVKVALDLSGRGGHLLLGDTN